MFQNSALAGKPSTDSAWIAPDGTFYPVYVTRGKNNWMDGHCVVAEQLGDNTGGRKLEKDGWVHLSGGIPQMYANMKATQDQMNALMDVWSAFQREEEDHRRRAFERTFSEMMETM